MADLENQPAQLTNSRRLVDCPGYAYRAIVTSVPYAAEAVTRMYAGRADSENRIKELNENFKPGHLFLKSFDATDAAFRMGDTVEGRDFGFLMGPDLDLSRAPSADPICHARTRPTRVLTLFARRVGRTANCGDKGKNLVFYA